MLVLIRVDRNSWSEYKYITQSNGLVRCSLTAGKTNSNVDSKQTLMKFLFEDHAKWEYFVFCGLSNYLALEGYELLISDALHLYLFVISALSLRTMFLARSRAENVFIGSLCLFKIYI